MLYDLGFLLFSIFYLPTLIFKGKLHGEFGERFANYGKAKRAKLAGGKNTIWIQAVSVGEVALCKTLIPKLKESFPENSIVLSTITKTGNDLAAKLFSNDAAIIYFPLDFSFTVKKAAAAIRPAMYIMVETEIWPNLLSELDKKGVPSVMVNGRISDRSYGKYLAVKGFLKNTLDKINLFCMQSKTDAERIKALGAPEDRVRVTGNMKFDAADISSGEMTEEDLFVAGSTHRGEEEIVLNVFKELAVEFPGLKLLIAPRHIERAGELKKLVANSASPARISVLDTIGSLSGFYKKAKLVFIGGSLVKHGGQNPIEPASFGKAVMFGPYMFNFKAVSEAFLDSGAAICVNNGKELLEQSRLLLDDKAERDALGRKARIVISSMRGATTRNMDGICETLSTN